MPINQVWTIFIWMLIISMLGRHHMRFRQQDQSLRLTMINGGFKLAHSRNSIYHLSLDGSILPIHCSSSQQHNQTTILYAHVIGIVSVRGWVEHVKNIPPINRLAQHGRVRSSEERRWNSKEDHLPSDQTMPKDVPKEPQLEHQRSTHTHSGDLYHPSADNWQCDVRPELLHGSRGDGEESSFYHPGGLQSHTDT